MISNYDRITTAVLAANWSQWLYWARSNNINPNWRQSKDVYRWYNINKPLDRLLLLHPNLTSVVVLSISNIKDGYKVLQIGQWARVNNLELHEHYLK